jgi:hypothetical protein
VKHRLRWSRLVELAVGSMILGGLIVLAWLGRGIR